MKVPLRYQITRCDCGPTSMLNALSVLCGREEIRPEILKFCYALMIDLQRGMAYTGGTSEAAMASFARWLVDCHNSVSLPLDALHIQDSDVAFVEGSLLVRWIDRGGVAVTSCFLCDSDHYVLLDGIERDADGRLLGARMWDPWYLDEKTVFSCGGTFEGYENDVRFIGNAPFSHNRLVSAHLLEAPQKCHYSLICDTPREATLIRRTDSNLVDYMI